MNAVVTGGAGFIGSNLVDALIERGDRVTVIDDLSTGRRENVSGRVRFIEADILDVRRAIDKRTDVVFHLAASVGNARSLMEPQHDSRVNVGGTIAVLEAARAARAKVVYSSSAGIFGELKTLPITEDHPQEPDSPYGVSKLAAEKLCLAYNRLYGMRNVCLRYFNVYGPRQHFDAYGNVIPIFADGIATGRGIRIYGDGEQTRDFVNVSDVVQANIKAADADASGAFNIGSGESVTISALAATMIRLFGIATSVVHRAERKGDVRDSIASVVAAREAFGYEPSVPLADGLAEYVDWYRHEPHGSRHEP